MLNYADSVHNRIVNAILAYIRLKEFAKSGLRKGVSRYRDDEHELYLADIIVTRINPVFKNRYMRDSDRVCKRARYVCRVSGCVIETGIRDTGHRETLKKEIH